MGALSVTGQPKYRNGFGPLVEPVRFLPFGDIAAARAAITDKTCAVILEPIQAEGGILLPPPGYLQELRRLCTDTGTVLIFDEVQTGSGRTGTFYAFENEGVVPDVVTLAKGLAGGVPIGAMLANEEVGARLRAGHARVDVRRQPAGHGGGAVRAARDRLGEPARALPRRRLAPRLGAAAAGRAAAPEDARRARPRSAAGLVIDGDAAPMVARARERGLLVSVAGGNVIRFAPPLIVSKAEIDQAIEIFDGVLGAA